MTSQFKSFLKFAANAAVVILIIGFIVPGVYRAVKRVPPSVAAVTSLTSAASQMVGDVNTLLLTFNDALPAPTAGSANCDLDAGGASAGVANTCYAQPLGVSFFDGGTAAQVLYVARGTEFCTARTGCSFTNAQAVVGITDGSNGTLAPGSGDTFTIGLTNFTNVQGVAGNNYAFNCSGPCAGQAGNGVNTLELVDTDTTGPALDGRDFRFNWTAQQTTPTGYSGTRLYIVPASNSSIAANNVSTNGCGGSACQDIGFTTQYGQNNWNVAQSFNKDSHGTSWSATAYRGCVLIDAATDTLDCAPLMTPTSDTVTDTAAPNIDHISAISYISGAELIIYALVSDDQTTTAEFVGGTNGAYVQILHDGGSPNVTTTQGQVSQVAGTPNLWRFETNTALTRNMRYYLKVRDKAGNIRYFTSNPAVDTNPASTDANAEVAAFTVQAVSAGSISISGNILNGSSGNNIADSAFVFLGGLGVAGVNTSSGAYTFANVPAGSYDVTAAKTDFCDATRFEPVSANKTGINLSLNLGTCILSGPGGGEAGGTGSGKPSVVFSGPPNGDFAAPINQAIRVGFNQSLNAGTVNDTDPTNGGSNVYLTTNGSDRVAGTVTYCATNTSPGCTALFSQDTNTILFTPTANLSSNTLYTLVVGSAVTGDSGQSVEGNRPGGGHEITFTTQGDSFANFTAIGANFGTGGQYMPPFVESMIPAPGIKVTPNAKILLTFNEPMSTATITTNNILLKKSGAVQTITLSTDNNTRKTVTITPAAALTAGDYEVEVLGAVANTTGIPMRNDQNSSNPAFVSRFTVAGSADTTPPTLQASFTSGATGIPVNDGYIEFGAGEVLDPSSLTTSNVTLQRGSTSITATVKYNPGENSVFVVPSTVLAPNTTYTITFGTGVKDLNGNALSASQPFTFTTSGSVDSTGPKIRDARCDDYTCTFFFTEAVTHASQTDPTNYEASVLKPENFTLTQGPVGSPTQTPVILSGGTTMSYDTVDFAVKIAGLTLTRGNEYRVVVNAAIKDLTGNALVTASSANQITGVIEDSTKTSGTFGGGGMFGPPPTALGGGGGNFNMTSTGGFGGFTPGEFLSGEAVMAFPFNQTAGADSNVFEIKVPMSKAALAPVDSDQFVFTFPKGTTLTNAKADTFSPFFTDLNQQQPGVIKFDTTFDTDGVQVDTAALTVTVQIDVVSGTPTNQDYLTFSLSGITNPTIAKGPETGGHTLGVKIKRGGTVKTSLTSMPYFINEAGNNTITVNIYAGSQSTPTPGANGNVFVFAGGPGGGMNKNVTLANGVISAVDGTVASSVSYTSLSNGCYHVGTDPFVTLGGEDYFGADRPEPICVTGGQSPTKNIVLTAASAGGTVPVIVKLVKTGGFGGADIDIFAGGPGRFVSKTLDDVGTPAANGYTINLPNNGFWNIGVGPAIPKGASAGFPDFDAFGGTPPAPIGLEVSGLPSAGAVKAGPANFASGGCTFNDATDTVTCTVRANSLNVPVQVTDGTTGLANVDVFMHQQGFGGGAFGRTDKNGNVTLKVADYGSYEIGAMKPGLGDIHKNVELRNVDSALQIFYQGTQTSTVALKLLQRGFTISGKVLDQNSNALSNMPVWGESTDGQFVHGGTASDGSYTLYVSAGTWTLRSELPPDKTSACGIFSKTVVITTASAANENIEPSSTTCYTVSGSLTVGGTAQANKPIFIMQWDSTADRPSGGFFRQTSTNSAGTFTADLPAGTYRFGSHDPSSGEVSALYTITAAKSDAHITSGTQGTITFAFTGGTASMNGFIELKKSGDRHTRIGKPINGANANVTIDVPEGTYSYFVNIFGASDFSGTVATGATATIDLGSTTLVTLSGTVKDASGNALSNARVSVDSSSGVHQDAITDSSGNYTLQVKSGSYAVSANRSGYVPTQIPATVALSADTAAYDFGGTAPDQTALAVSDKTISGTIYKADGTTPITKGYVWAENSSTGQVVSAPVDSTNGTYTLPVTAGTWTVDAVAPLAAETTLAGTVNTSDATADTGKNISLTADATRIPKTASSDVSVSTGGTVDDTDNSSMKLVIPSGTLKSNSSSSQGNATVVMAKTHIAPDTDDLAPVGDVSYEISVTDSNDLAVKDFSGNIEVIMEYDPTLLPAGVTESALKAVYYEQETGTYVPCEGGSTVDATNNSITCVVDHATAFSVVYPTASVTTATGSSYSRSVSTDTGVSSPTVDTVNTAANTVTSAAPNTIRTTVRNEAEFTKPLQLEARLIKTEGENKTAQLTGEGGSVVLKPSEEATVAVSIPANVEVTAGREWTGEIQPPVVASKSVIQEGGDYEVIGDRRTLTRTEVETVISVGSSTSSLSFSAPVTVNIPVNLDDGALVEVYSSQDGVLWEKVSAETYTVEEGRIVFATDHFTYFAVVPTGETVITEEAEGGAEAEAEAMAAVEIPFVDVKNHWSTEYVRKLYGLNIIRGKTPTRFAPNEMVTRAELAKMAVLAFGYEIPASVNVKPFKDVDTGAWYAPYVQVAKQNGILQGYSSGHFRPDNEVNRAEALKILLQGARVTVGTSAGNLFNDVSASAWYAPYVSFARTNNIVSGYSSGKFGPANYITRAEVAKMIVNLLEME